ncbi:hypothetical protein E3Q23_02607 [Wallemia mellicola]|uniref:Uncharacterized protein n=1 Tax=Wallemia mellicola TaxID=1708541 RepID=A0A4T0QJ91_9BASI|nr:hypothetical protein E3Q23_02607 [Wallemia mellicola]TIB99273.1 hypothetical protein E3Q17_02649 [Wallemia mellicola]TIC10533.1 hypothetical protein E3Q14_02739 [Wallemia mellicola]TIC23728.1 hypothetical protein E3Q11_03793 [Wallemia mellicola]TIC64325.1 hypothetical protein E3Q01_02813 [Wallemia mellicola]
MKLLTLLSLCSAAFAASLGTQHSLMIRQASVSAQELIDNPQLETCYENQCAPIREKLQSDCLSILENSDPDNMDEKSSLEYSTCICDSFDYVQQNSDCDSCIRENDGGTTDEVGHFCTGIRSLSDDEDVSSSISNIPPAKFVASSCLLVAGLSFL